MKNKSLFCIVIEIFSVFLILSAIVLDGKVPDIVDGILMGFGAALTGLNISIWQFLRWRKNNPAKWRQYKVESKDERNAIIRLRAQAVAGKVLQWIAITVAWVAIFMNAPLWMVLAPVGIFLFKSILEVCLMARYQKEM